MRAQIHHLLEHALTRHVLHSTDDHSSRLAARMRVNRANFPIKKSQSDPPLSRTLARSALNYSPIMSPAVFHGNGAQNPNCHPFQQLAGLYLAIGPILTVCVNALAEQLSIGYFIHRIFAFI